MPGRLSTPVSTRRGLINPSRRIFAAEPRRRDRYGAPQVELIAVQAVMPQVGVTSPVLFPVASTPSP